jgi:hypothetical protein
MTAEPEFNTDPATIQDEETPLLERTGAIPIKISPWQRLLNQHVITLCLILIVLVEIGAYLQTAPLNELIEQIICNEHIAKLEGGSLIDPQDPRCKSARVQGKLAMLRGWQSTFDCIPGKLASLFMYSHLWR